MVLAVISYLDHAKPFYADDDADADDDDDDDDDGIEPFFGRQFIMTSLQNVIPRFMI